MDDKKVQATADFIEDTTPRDNGRLLGQEKDNALGTRAETSLRPIQAVKYYPKAIAWCLTISMATIMESYDLVLINSFIAFPQFEKKYGVQLPDGSYSIPSEWQMGLTMALVVGMIPGVFANGWLVDRFGYRRVMLLTHMALICCICGTFFAPSVEILLVGCLLIAVPCGVFAAATPGYSAELCPMALRGYLTTYVNLCWVIGHMIGAGVLIAELHNDTQWSYRIPYGIQWIWPPFLAVACWFAPESPWWLVKKGRDDEAIKVMERLLSVPDDVVNRKNIVAMMSHTIQTEKDLHIGGTYVDCFKGTNRRRTEIAMISWGCQILPGFAIQNYAVYFFTMAGLSSDDSFKLAMGMYTIAFIGTVLSWFVQTWFGRRQIYMAGLCVMAPLMLIIGFLDVGPSSSSLRWAQAALLLVWFLAYGVTIGPIPYAIAAEVGASRLRSKTISLGRNTYYFLSIINAVVAPYMLNPTAGNLKGKAAFPAAGLAFLLLLWAFLRLPETKGLTPETLDYLFRDHVPARRFPEEATKFQ